MKKYLSILLAAAVVTGLAGCGGSNTGTTQAPATQASESKAPDAQADTQADDAEETEASGTGDFHIGIVTGSVSQSEDDRRGAEAFQAMYGEDMVKLAIYPDNFTEELETTIQTSLFQVQPKLSVRLKKAVRTSSVSQVRVMRTCRRSEAPQTWSATTTSLRVVT